ncbi:MAG: hypothetical protein ACI9DK_001615 [Vicingaceae bacterium]
MELLTEDFIEFLYLRGINKFEWKLLLDYSSAEALNILGNYSEMTFEKVMRTVNFLEYRTTNTLELINCTDRKIISIFLELPLKSNLNFLKIDSVDKLQATTSLSSKQISKRYFYSREKDIFNLIESGYKVVDKKMFSYLDITRKSQLN